MRHKRWIDLCLRLTKKNNMPKYRHTAVLVKSGRVLAFGFNNKFRAGKLAHPIYGLKGWHSEADCLLSVHKEKIRGAELYVTGVTKTGKLVNSKPCPCCQDFISKYKLKGVYYLNESGDVCKYA